MSDNIKANKALEEATEISRKKYEVDKHKVESLYDDLIERKKQNEINSSIDLSYMPKERIDKIKKETREYLINAKNSKCFINNDFRGKVPFFARNLLLVAAQTGHGKTTIGKNIAYHTLIQGGSVGYVTNEENPGDVYNGVAALLKGWSYVRHENFTEEQMDEFERLTDILSQRLTVVDDNFNNSHGATTTLEGVKSILNNLLRIDRKYDVIIIDYYQNICNSIERPYLKDWQVQEEFAKFLDTFKNIYPAPIVVLSQLKPGKELPFKEAIEGRKMVLNVSTCAMKVTAEKDMMRTAFEIMKTRFTEANGDVIYTGFNKGKYVDYTDDFKAQAELRRLEKEQRETLSNVFGGKNEED